MNFLKDCVKGFKSFRRPSTTTTSNGSKSTTTNSNNDDKRAGSIRGTVADELQLLVEQYGEKTVQDSVRDILGCCCAAPPNNSHDSSLAYAKMMMQASMDAMLVVDLLQGGDVLQLANEGARSLFGLPSEDKVRVASFLLHDDKMTLERLLEEQSLLVQAKRYDTGKPLTVRVKATRMVLEQQQQHHQQFVTIVCRPDATTEEEEQQQNQTARRKQTDQLHQSILDASLEAMVVTDDQGDIIEVNATLIRMFGFETTEQVIGTNVERLVGGIHSAHHRTYMQRFRERGGTTSILGKRRQLVARRVDGTEFTCQISVRKVPNTEWMVAFIRDTTDETQAQAEALKEAQLNQSILESSLDAVVVTDHEGTIQKVNPAMLQIFGFESIDHVVGKNIDIIVEKKHAGQHKSYMKGFHERGQTSSILGTKRQFMARRCDGSEFPCRIGVRKVPGISNDLMVGFIQDITSETRAVELAMEKHAAEELLFNMLPKEIAHRLKKDPNHIADHFAEATILFADIVGFTRMSNSLTPAQVVAFLNRIFSRFDAHLDHYGLNKVKTIGDCYMVTSIPGCTSPPKSCAATCHFAMDMIKELDEYNREHPDAVLNMRIGINAGPVVAGVVGTKRFLYDIWGDAVNVASRMESTGEPGKVQVTQAVVDIVADTEAFKFEKRGMVQVKGIGEMETYFITERDISKRSKYLWKRLRANILRSSSSRENSSSSNAEQTRAVLELLQSVNQLDTPQKDEPVCPHSSVSPPNQLDTPPNNESVSPPCCSYTGI